MIRVYVELDRYGLGTEIKGLTEVHIINDGTGSQLRGNYTVRALDRRGERVIRESRVEDWPRTSRPVSSLLRAALEALGY